MVGLDGCQTAVVLTKYAPSMGSVLYYIVLLVFTLAYFVVFALLFVLTVGLDRERKALHVASRVWARTIFRLCPTWRLVVEGGERVDRHRPWVIVTNHQSMLDIPLLYVVPLLFKWVSKQEVKRMPVFGLVLYMHGDILIERGSRDSARQMVEKCTERLKRGTSVMIFPEGTRTKTGEMGRFKDGAFYVAQHAGVGIQPVVIDGTWNLVQGWRLRMPHTFRVRMLDPLSADEVAAEGVKELASTLEARMKAALQSMRDKTDQKNE